MEGSHVSEPPNFVLSTQAEELGLLEDPKVLNWCMGVGQV